MIHKSPGTWVLLLVAVGGFRLLHPPACKSRNEPDKSSANMALTSIERRDALLSWLPELGILALAIVIRLKVGPLLIDDAYITFRYARQLMEGHGLVYNIGEHVLGISSPLMAWILAIVGIIVGGNIEQIAFWIGVLAAGGVIGSVFFAIHDTPFRLGGRLFGLLIAVMPRAVFSSVSGMETMLFTMLIVLTWACYLRGFRKAAIVVATLAVLTRPEGSVVAGFLFVGMFLEGTLVVSEWLFPLLIIALWFGISWVYFSSPIPNSVIAKATIYPSYAFRFHNFLAIASYIVYPWGLSADPVLSWRNALICWSAFSVSVIPLRRIKVWLPVGWFLLVLGGYSVTNRYMFPWYGIPLMAMWWLFILLGLSVAVRRVIRYKGKRLIGIVLLLVVITFFVFLLSLVCTLPGHKKQFESEIAHREKLYLCIGRNLRATFPDGEVTVASPEVGALGYAYQGQIEDLGGLISPDALRYYRAPDFHFRYPHDIPLDLVKDQKPEIVVLFSNLSPSVYFTSWFRNAYVPVYERKQAHPFYGDLGVFVRADQKANDVLRRELAQCIP